MGAATRAGYEFLVSLYNLRGRIYGRYDWLGLPPLICAQGYARATIHVIYDFLVPTLPNSVSRDTR